MEKNKDLEFDIRIVLVRPIYDRNIGAAARAMTNMGAGKLILIAPQCEVTLEAHQAAASGQKPLEDRVTYENWIEFYQSEPRGIQIATSARDGRGRQSEDLSETLSSLKMEFANPHTPSDTPILIHFIFGPEDAGLTTKDLELANHCCSIATYGDNTSLNLAQAILLTLYTFRTLMGSTKAKLEGQQKPRPLQKPPEQIFPEATLKQWLETMNVDLSKKKMNMYTVIKKMLLRNNPTAKELTILETALQQSIRKMKLR